MQNRLDEEMVQRGLVRSRSQAANLIKLGKVKLAARIATKPAQRVLPGNQIEVLDADQYVSRAAYKLKSATQKLNLRFTDKTVLDVGSSTGGFTQFALKNGATKVIAVDVGTDQLHPLLHGDPRIELHEKTDVRELKSNSLQGVDIVVIDVSFVSLRDILPSVTTLIPDNAMVVAMVKPQFEAGTKLKNKGVIKNDTIRRQILKDFESWAKRSFSVVAKADSEVTGKKGNAERFYLLKQL